LLAKFGLEEQLSFKVPRHRHFLGKKIGVDWGIVIPPKEDAEVKSETEI
jgi:hypothetical protein